MGMRIIARVREEYGNDDDENVDVLNPWANDKSKEADADAEAQKRIMDQRDEEMAGGFLPEGYTVEEPEEHHHRSFFPVVAGSDDEEDGGGFVIEDHDDERANSSTSQAYATPLSILSKSGKDQPSEEDIEMQDGESDAPAAPAPKKRGKPAGSTKNLVSTKAKALGKRTTVEQKATTSKSVGKRKAVVQDSAEDDEESSLSEIESDLSDTEEPPKNATKRGAARRATMPAKTSNTPRKTPKRTAARKSETALRSHYFEHTDDE